MLDIKITRTAAPKAKPTDETKLAPISLDDVVIVGPVCN